MRVEIIEQPTISQPDGRVRFRVLVSGYRFPERDLSYRLVNSIEEAVALREAIQQGRVAMRRMTNRW